MGSRYVFDKERHTNSLDDLPRAMDVIPYTGPKRPDNTMVYYPGRDATVEASDHVFRDDNVPPTTDSHRVPWRNSWLALDETIIVPANG